MELMEPILPLWNYQNTTKKHDFIWKTDHLFDQYVRRSHLLPMQNDPANSFCGLQHARTGYVHVISSVYICCFGNLEIMEMKITIQNRVFVWTQSCTTKSWCQCMGIVICYMRVRTRTFSYVKHVICHIVSLSTSVVYVHLSTSSTCMCKSQEQCICHCRNGHTWHVYGKVNNVHVLLMRIICLSASMTSINLVYGRDNQVSVLDFMFFREICTYQSSLTIVKPCHAYDHAWANHKGYVLYLQHPIQSRLMTIVYNLNITMIIMRCLIYINIPVCIA